MADQLSEKVSPHLARLAAAEGVLKVKLAETPREWAQIEFLFKEWGEAVPDPKRAFVAIALDEHEEVVALQVMQFVLHAEPLWVAPAWRGKFNVLRLVSKLESHLRSILPHGFSYFILATRRNVEKLASLAGMQVVAPGTMFRKDVRPLGRIEPMKRGEEGKESGEVA